MITKTCPTCGENFQANRSNAVYCSTRCKSMARKHKDSEGHLIKPSAEPEQDPESMESLAENDEQIFNQIQLLNEIISRLDQVLTIQNRSLQREEQYLVPAQACKLLSINRSTFDRFVHEGIFKIYRLGKAKVYVKRSEIDQLFQG